MNNPTDSEIVKACRDILWPSGHPDQDREREWTCDHLEALASVLEISTEIETPAQKYARRIVGGIIGLVASALLFWLSESWSIPLWKFFVVSAVYVLGTLGTNLIWPRKQ